MTSEARVHLTIKWLDRAAYDLEAAKHQFAERTGYQPYHTCFWAQQAAEKAIKAALTFESLPFEHTHNLDDLVTRLPEGWQVRRVAGRLLTLASYGVDTRYPDPLREPTRQDAEQAITQAQAIYGAICRDLVRRQCPLPPRHIPGDRPSTQTPRTPNQEEKRP